MNIRRFFYNYILRRPVHLRSLFAFGVEIEERAERFYQTLAGKSKDIAVRSLSFKLAEEERLHKEEIRDILDRWDKLEEPMDDESRRLFEAELMKKKLFLEEPGENLTERGLIRYALKQERRMIKYYRAFKRRFPQSWKKEVIDRILAEEEAHMKELKNVGF